jgi:hypothetical protein
MDRVGVLVSVGRFFGLLFGILWVSSALAGQAGDAGSARPVLVVTAAAPLDGERLADALRAYLDEFHIDVRTAPAAPQGDLRAELAATADIGAAVRAWAVVRIADGAPGSAEIELVDRVTTKSLVATVLRPRRDEDLYRAVALKVQALLRATLAEPGAALSSSPALTRLAGAAAPETRTWAEERFSLETAFAVVAFPVDGLTQQGLSLSTSLRVGDHAEVAVGTEALSALRADTGAVSAVVNRVPVSLAARLRLRRERWDATAGLLGEAALVTVATSSATLSVRSGWSVVPAVGAQVGGRLRLADPVWLCLRAAALGVIVGQHYSAQGQPLVSMSGLQLDVEAGLGVALW